MRAMNIRPYIASDRTEWLRMRRALWPPNDLSLAPDPEIELDADQWLARSDAAVFVAHHPDRSGLVGFAEVGERPYADGSSSSPIAFLEAWYVDPDARHQGIGKALIAAIAAWARSRGLRELASDALLENLPAHLAHAAVGFTEVERSVKFLKPL